MSESEPDPIACDPEEPCNHRAGFFCSNHAPSMSLREMSEATLRAQPRDNPEPNK